MTWTLNHALACEAFYSARQAAAGQQASDVAYRIAQLLGSAPDLTLLRNGTTAAVLTYEGPLSSTGEVVTVPDATSSTLADSDIDTGTWTGTLASSDGTYSMSAGTVGKTATYDVYVSADIVAADGVVSSGEIGMPADLSSSPAVPGVLPDYDLATWYCSAALTYAAHTATSNLDTDWEGKTSAGSDARKRFASEISEPGTSYDGSYQIERLVDPILGGSKRAIRLRTGADWGLSWDSAAARRNELSDRLSGATNYAIPGREYMVCFANTRPSSDSWSAGADWQNFFGVFQVHPYDGQSPPIMISYGNGGRSPVLIRRSSLNTSGEPWVTLGGTLAANTWIGWLVHFKLSSTTAGSPFIKIYRADGLLSWSLVHSETGVPNTYSTTSSSAHHFKSGMYGTTSNLGTVATPGVTMLHKGVLAFDLTTNAGACDEASMLEHLRSV